MPQQKKGVKHMKHGKWKVTCNPIGDGYLYEVYRLIDVNSVDHSGNREYATDYMKSEEDALKIASQMNAGDSDD